MRYLKASVVGIAVLLPIYPASARPPAVDALAQVASDMHAGDTVVRDNLALELRGVRLRNARVPMATLGPLTSGAGITIELWLTRYDLSTERTIFDSRNEAGRGVAIMVERQGVLALELNDGRRRVVWRCALGVLRIGALQHVVFAVGGASEGDGTSEDIAIFVDGCLREGGTFQTESAELPEGDLSGGTLLAPRTHEGMLKGLRIYKRRLHGSEVARNYQAELHAAPPRTLPPVDPEIAPVDAPFAMRQPERPRFPAQTWNIGDLGAVPGGEELNTKVIDAAIKACAAAGGGRVLVPKGTWLTGPVHLRSNVELHLAKDAVLRFSTDPSHYLPAVFTRWAGFECYNYSPLIYARDCTNIAITGEGRLDGQGEAWWPWVLRQNAMSKILLEMGRTGTPVEQRVFGNSERPLRPQFISPIGCKNVLIEGISLNAGPFWTIHCVYCENVIVRGIAVDNYGPNNDGVNLDSCKNALVEYCEFNTGDDCIALKSGINEDGWRVGRATENVVVRHCLMKDGHGSVVIGSEMSGDVRNVYAHDCRSYGTERGFRLKSARGRGGIVENVWIDNMLWEEMRLDTISVNAFYKAWAVTEAGKAPIFRNIHLSNITCRGARAAANIVGLPEQLIENVTFEKLTISARTGIRATDVAGFNLRECRILPEKGPAIALKNNRDATIDGLISSAGATLLRLEGERTRTVRFTGQHGADGDRVSIGPGVDPRQLRLCTRSD